MNHSEEAGDALTRISRARLCLQERAPALYPHQAGSCFLPAIRAAKGSATQTHPGDNAARDRWGEQNPSSSHSYISSAQLTGARSALSRQEKETQGHNWKSGSAELEGAVHTLMFSYRQAMLKVDEKQRLT